MFKCPQNTSLAKTIEREANDQDVGNGANHSVDKDAQRVGQEVSAVEGEGGIKDDGGKKDVEEEVGSELEDGVLLLSACPDQGAHHNSKDDQEARLREAVEDGYLVVVDVDQDAKDHGEGDTGVPFVVRPSEGYQMDPTVPVVVSRVITVTVFSICVLIERLVTTSNTSSSRGVCANNCCICGGFFSP